MNSSVESSDDGDEEYIRAQTRKANRKGKKAGGFQVMGLSSGILTSIHRKGYKVPTPIQRKTIPLLMAGNDVVAMARTGSGKSAAFLIPMLEKLKAHTSKSGARALVLSPTRELATQLAKFTRDLGKLTDLKCAVVVGGDKLDEQFEAMATNPDIIIATPGRFMHLMMEMDLNLKTIEYLVFDEADRLFEMGFAETLKEILFRLSPDRQTCLFSATLPKTLVDFARAGLSDPKLVRLDADSKISPDLQLAFVMVNETEKEACLLHLIRNVIPETDQSIIFVSTKHHVEYLHELLLAKGIKNSFIYGSLDQTARKLNLEKFRNKVTKFLVVTDVAARGIDIPLLNNVIHYDFCDKSKLFVHRSGRAARAGRTGTAYSFITNDDLPHLVDLQLFLGRNLVFGSEANESGTDVIVGDYPAWLYQDELNEITGLLETNSSLTALKKTSTNGRNLYMKTRVKASKESYVRSKSVIETAPRGSQKLGIHPIFSKFSSKEAVDSALLDRIRNFRPQETIFEVRKMGMKIGDAGELMKSRRERVGKVIEKVKEIRHERMLSETTNKTLDAPSGDNADDEYLEEAFGIRFKRPKKSFVDSEYYVKQTPDSLHADRQYAVVDSFRDAQMDVIGDDTNQMKRQQFEMKFDKKKGKYVKQTVGRDNKKRIRSETGQLLPATLKSEAFDKWKKKKGKHLTPELMKDTRLSARKGRTFKHNKITEGKPLDKYSYDYEKKLKQRREKLKKALDGEHSTIDTQTAVKMKHKFSGVKNELKSADRVKKERKLLEKRREKNARPSKKKKPATRKGKR